MNAPETYRMTVTGWSPEVRAEVRELCSNWLAEHPHDRTFAANYLCRIVLLIDEVNAAEAVKS